MRNSIEKFVLKNAFQFKGSVNSKVVLGLVLRDNPDFKKDVPEVVKIINEVIGEVSKLSIDEIKSKLKQIAPELLIEKKKEEIKGPLKVLSNAERSRFKVRIAPSPSGPLHIGHAYGAALNFEYAKMYDGKFITRIEDTNPENIYPPAYELIKDDAAWITNNSVSETIIQSSRLGIYYDHAEKLVAIGKAYVCICDNDVWREMKAKKEACPCRSIGIKDQQIRYAKMFGEYAEGEVVLRLKTDIEHKNPAMRDFSIMRVNEHIHPKTGKEQRVWPLMVLSVAIDDHLLGITHVLNGKDHTDNAKKEALIMEYLGWKAPTYKHWGRINFEGFKLSTSKTRIAIEQGEYTGWDDPRLATLMALRKRGYQPEALRKFAIEVGLSLNDKTVSWDEFWKMIDSFNREIVEPKANRYFFVEDPVKLSVKGLNKNKFFLDLHPDFKNRGSREFVLSDTILIAKKDFDQLKEGKVHRLIDCFNFKIESEKIIFVSEIYEDFQSSNEKGKIIHWLPNVDDNVEVELLTVENKRLKGIGEKSLVNLKEGEIVQLQRMCFSRIDKIKDCKVTLYYLHK